MHRITQALEKFGFFYLSTNEENQRNFGHGGYPIIATETLPLPLIFYHPLTLCIHEFISAATTGICRPTYRS